MAMIAAARAIRGLGTFTTILTDSAGLYIGFLYKGVSYLEKPG
jgi:hypothetical protein